MKFAAILPVAKRVMTLDAPTVIAAQEQICLGEAVDHGVIVPPHRRPSGVGIAIIVGERSLFQPKTEQKFFVIGRQLYAGAALLYGFDRTGETVDLVELPSVCFIAAHDIEAVIAAGNIERPTMVMNGHAVWQWPEPQPDPWPPG